MAKKYFRQGFEFLRDQYRRFWVHKKKVRALENFAEANFFEGQKYIPILKEILSDGFLDEEEEKFLDHQIQKVQIDALTWAHKTSWVKAEARRLKQAAFNSAKHDAQILMPFLNGIPRSTVKVPVHLLAFNGSKMPGKRV